MQKWQNPETLTLWIIIIAVFLILLLFFIILLVRTSFKKMVRAKNKEAKSKIEYQKSLLETSIKTQEKERKRVAEDIHDALIGKLTVLQMESQIKDPNSNSVKLIDECISTARRISHDLSPPLLEYSSLTDLIEELVDPWKKVFQVTYISDIRNDDTHSNEMKIHITRIIQELFNNISKYAEAESITVHLRQSKSGLCILLRDDGVGFSMDQHKKGLGLKNIESRVQYLKGQYKMKSKIGVGTSTLFIFNLSNNNLNE